MQASQVAVMVKNPPASAGDLRDGGLIPGLGRSPGEGHGNPLQHSCQENPMDRGVQHSQKGWVVWFGGDKGLNDMSLHPQVSEGIGSG